MKKGEYAKSAVRYCKNRGFGPGRAGNFGAKLDKNHVRIEVKIKIDFEVDFGLKMEPTLAPKGAKMEPKSVQIR